MATINTPRYQMNLTLAKLDALGVGIDHSYCRNEEFKVTNASNSDNDYLIAIPKEQVLKIDLNSLPNFWKFEDAEYGVRGLNGKTSPYKDKPMVILKFKLKR